jgi:hypothetical protein
MAWSDPGDFTSGQILTAAQMDSVREAMFFGQATFTNEAARDAAIPATGITLQEGMRAYLTAPTAPAATGLVTAVPTGITTVYNGSAWVCATPVGANTVTSGTTASSTYTPTLAAGGTNPSVTLTTGTTAQVMLSSRMTMAGTTSAVFVSVAVSGATTLAASDDYGAHYAVATSGYYVTASQQIILTGLTSGVNTFTLQYRSGSAAITGTFVYRTITVRGIA